MRVPNVLRSSRVRQVMAIPLAACLFGGLVLIASSPSGASVAATAATRSLSASSSSGCVKGTAQGVTSSTVTLAVTEVAISGGALTNATIGVPSTQVQENDWNTVAQSINKSGGAGCRKLVLKFYPVNPIDAAGAQQSCLTIAASKPFMVLDVGALSAVNASNCIPTAKVAYASQYLTPDQLTKYYPYYLQLLGVPATDIRNSVLGFNQLGYFKASKGFKKLGVLYATCNPSLIVAERAALKEAACPEEQDRRVQPGLSSRPELHGVDAATRCPRVQERWSDERHNCSGGHLIRHIYSGGVAAELQAAVLAVERLSRSAKHHGCRHAGHRQSQRRCQRDGAGLR